MLTSSFSRDASQLLFNCTTKAEESLVDILSSSLNKANLLQSKTST